MKPGTKVIRVLPGVDGTVPVGTIGEVTNIYYDGSLSIKIISMAHSVCAWKVSEAVPGKASHWKPFQPKILRTRPCTKEEQN
jgi:hypothetical protein